MRVYQPVRKKWFHHVGVLRVVKTKSGELRMRGPESPEHACMGDRHLLDVFVWLGRYLALKGKLPKHVALEEIAVKAQRVPRAIREVVAAEIYDNTRRANKC